MKLKTKIFNIVTYSMLFYSIAGAVYVAFPQIQELIPTLTIPTVAVSGAFTALLGSAGLVVQAFLYKARQQADTQFLDIMKYQKTITEHVDNILEQNKKLQNELTDSYNKLKKEVKRNNQLQTAHLEVKRSDILIDEKAKKLLEEVLANEKK